MTLLDIFIILFILLCVIGGFKRGIIKETVSIVGLIIIFVIAFIFKEQLGNILCKFLPFIPLKGSLEGLVSINILIYQSLAFVIIFGLLSSIYMIVVKLSSVLQKLVNFTLVLLLPSKIGGAVVAGLKGYLLTFVVLIAVMVPFKDINMISESTIANKILYNTPVLSKSTGSITNSISEIYTLGDKLSKEELTTNEANLETIDIMLKYKVVSKKTVEQLVVLDKLKEVKGINKVLEKYE